MIIKENLSYIRSEWMFKIRWVRCKFEWMDICLFKYEGGKRNSFMMTRLARDGCRGDHVLVYKMAATFHFTSIPISCLSWMILLKNNKCFWCNWHVNNFRLNLIIKNQYQPRSRKRKRTATLIWSHSLTMRMIMRIINHTTPMRMIRIERKAMNTMNKFGYILCNRCSSLILEWRNVNWMSATSQDREWKISRRESEAKI